jgi:hypothetical protein
MNEQDVFLQVLKLADPAERFVAPTGLGEVTEPSGSRDEPQPLVGEPGGHRQYRFSPEPRGENAGEVHIQGKRPASDHEHAAK